MTRSLVLHEMGHTTGLFHSIQLERPGGNRFPDNDRSVAASGRPTHTIVYP